MTILEHICSRYVDTVLHRVWIDEQSDCATFPLWNLSGQMVGYQQYRPYASKEKRNDPRHGRYFTRVKDGKIAVWGLESFHLSKVLFVTEGIFDAARISYLGYAAVATLSNDSNTTTSTWFRLIRSYKYIVAVCDNDTAGRSLAKLGHAFHVVENFKDLGDASDTYVETLISKYR